MKTTKTPLAQIKQNPGNPRTISPENLELLINSILEFPRMLEIRPVVVDKGGMILGGNMRHKALVAIAGMSADEISARIGRLRGSEDKTEDEIRKSTSFWLEWLKSPYLHVVDASTLTEADYMQWLWNNPQSGQSPYKLFEGALVPDGHDPEGNIIYRYNGARF